jgi:hypothetical protein
MDGGAYIFGKLKQTGCFFCMKQNKLTANARLIYQKTIHLIYSFLPPDTVSQAGSGFFLHIPHL